MPGLSPDDLTALDRFRACVLGDEALQAELGKIEIPERFAEAASVAAMAHGISLSRAAVLASAHPDPAGLSRFMPVSANAVDWPSKAWLPVHVMPAFAGGVRVDWAHFAGERLTDPFFENSLRRILDRPFNRMFPYRTTLDEFAARARLDEALAPDGLIFHMSRCGSTLVAQMLAAVSRNLVISEAPPLDTIVQLCRNSPALPPAEQSRLLGAMVAALGRKRAGDERHYVLKLDSWHTLALPLFRRAFPAVPWVFLYREPVEVLVSHMRVPGMHTIPGVLSPSPFGIDGGERMPAEEYCARVLQTICAAALDNLPLGGGLFINYDELPDAVCTRILPHFGIMHDDSSRAAMQRAARNDAKMPYREFASDRASKQSEATTAIRGAAELHLAEVYQKLEARRQTAC
jgi:hypothetical protein